MQKASKPQVDRVWEVIENAGVCMLITHSDLGLRARPMEPKPDRDENSIWFLTDIRGLKDDEIRADRDVCLTCFHAEEKVYLSLTAEASVLRDKARARALWDSKQNAWWSGPEDPNLILLRVMLKRAEMWDGPASSAVAAFEFAKSRVLGTKPNLGEERKIIANLK
jgi:general stress protein 26